MFFERDFISFCIIAAGSSFCVGGAGAADRVEEFVEAFKTAETLGVDETAGGGGSTMLPPLPT